MYLELRLATCACMLAIASILDMKTREVPDKVWVITGALGVAITIFELFDSLSIGNNLSPFLIHYFIGIAIVSSIGYATYRTGLFGGADPKALVAIAIIFPTYQAPLNIHDFPALSILSNALAASLAALLYNITRNTISLAKGVPIFEGIHEGPMRRALAFAVGSPSSSPSKYSFAMEEIDQSGMKRFSFNPIRYDEFAEVDNGRVWVTRALPFIVFLGAGFVIYLVAGDLFAIALRLVLP